VHPKTGHDYRTPRPDTWKLPKEINIRISQRCPDDELDCKVWYALLRGDAEWSNLTWGDTPAQAAYMAFDLMKLLWDECSPENEWGGEHYPHCYCRDVTDGPTHVQLDDSVGRYLQCCRCEQKTALSEFDGATDVVGK